MKLFVATPLYHQNVSHMYLRGALDAQKAFPEIEFSVAVGTYIAINRQTLTERFLKSKATHLLFVDSDIGWTAEAVQKLIDADVGMISGVYLQRNGQNIIAGEPIKQDFDSSKLIECFMVPAGFLLLKRHTIERMLILPEPMWSMSHHNGEFVGEDVAFCRRWRQMGGDVWLHPQAIVDHMGEVIFRPEHLPSPVRFSE